MITVLVVPILMASVFVLPKIAQPPDGCTMQKAFGLPCPFCGGTRCLDELLRFHIFAALKLHAPLVCLLFCLLVAWIIGLSALVGSRLGERCIAWYDFHRLSFLTVATFAFVITGFIWRLLVGG